MSGRARSPLFHASASLLYTFSVGISSFVNWKLNNTSSTGMCPPSQHRPQEHECAARQGTTSAAVQGPHIARMPETARFFL